MDITLTRGKGGSQARGGSLPDLAAHRRAVETLVTTLRAHRNWYLDLANEHDVQDERYVSDAELKTLREEVRRLDPERLVTASFGGHDLGAAEIRESVKTIGLDFLCPHRPRDHESPGQTEAKTRALLASMKDTGRIVPVLYQEPFRRGYGAWQPMADDFLADLRGAVAGSAAGWCFHNGSQRDAVENRPTRSFDLRRARLFDQLDAQERRVVDDAARNVAK